VNPPLRSPTLPGLFITGTDTGVGKTVVAGAIAAWLRQQGSRVGVLKPVATGCERRREGLVSADAEFLAHCADSPHPLDLICPVRYAEPLAPAVAAERAGQPVDWAAVQRSLDLIARDSDILVVEGVGGAMVPLDERHTVLDLVQWLGLATVVVARAGLGTINHTLLTVNALRAVGPVAGVVVSRYPADSPGVAEETNPRAIETWGRVPVLCVVPEETAIPAVTVPAGIAAAVGMVDWLRFAERHQR
jgi:dethiobiotin synthetase